MIKEVIGIIALLLFQYLFSSASWREIVYFALFLVLSTSVCLLYEAFKIHRIHKFPQQRRR